MNHEEGKEGKVLIGFILAVFIIVYNFVWINKTFVLPEGLLEFYSGLIDRGMIPYRDFYYYLPPLNLCIDYFFWKSSFGYVLVYRLYRLAERILIIEIMFSILSKYINSYIAGIGCFLATVLFSASVCDLGGDYNQTTQLLVVTTLFFLLKYIDGNESTKTICRIGIGFCGGCMAICKQPMIPGCGIVFSLLLFILTIYGYEKNPIRTIAYILIGFMIPVSISLIYLWNNNALHDFIYQAFIDTGSKGSIIQILFGRLIYTFYNKWLFCITVIVLFLAHCLHKDKLMLDIGENQSTQTFVNFINKMKNNSLVKTVKSIDFIKKQEFTKRDLYISLIWFSICMLVHGYWNKISWTLWIAWESGLLFLFVIQLLSVTIAANYKWEGRVQYVIIGIITYCVLILNYERSTELFFNNTNIFHSVRFIPTMMFIFLIVWVIYHMTISKLYDKEIDVKAVIICFSAIAAGYTMTMANGEPGVSSLPAILIVPAVIYLWFKNGYTKAKKCLLEISTLIIFTICLSQKLVCPYAWWGDKEESYWRKTETSNLVMLKGFMLSEKEKEKYDRLNQIIEKNSDKDSTIWSFPYSNVYNLFQNNYNMNGFVPILFYDLCADDFAIRDALNLSSHQPDIVIWIDIPNCMDMHESMFRNGKKLGQRFIQKWFSEAKKTDYILIGQVDNVFVYKLDNGSEHYSKYICDIDAVNQTAEYEYPLAQLLIK